MRNIVLTGFMGTGKSSVGRLLAEKVGFDFVDTDAIISERHGPIPEIFSELDEDAFRDMEHDVAIELAQRVGLVIATGGRMLLDDRNAAALDTTGTIFCLTATVDELISRLTVDGEHEKRPLLAGADPRQTIADLLAERSEGYGQFTQVDTTGRTIDQIAQSIVEQLS